MRNPQANVTLDKETRDLMNTLPREINLSAMVRVMIAGLGFSTDKEFEKYLKDNPDAARAKELLKPHFKRFMSR